MPEAENMINWQPDNLEDDLVKLTPLKDDGFDELYKVASDPLIWEQHPESNRHERDVFRIFYDGAINSGSAFVIRDRKSNEAIGSTRYYNHDRTASSICIGYTFLSRKYWGGRYNAAIKRLMIGYAFNYVDSVIFHIGAHNIRSQKATKKFGAVKTGEFSVIRNARPELNYEYTLSRSAWQEFISRLNKP